MGFPGGSESTESACNARDPNSIIGSEDPLEKEMATHSSTLAWKIPWTEELGAGYCPWGRKESGTTERLHFTSLHFTFMAIMVAQMVKHLSTMRETWV